MLARDIPTLNESWEQIWQFALSFDGYEVFSQDKLADNYGDLQRKFLANGKISKQITLTKLRAALFFAQRTWRWSDEAEPNGGFKDFVGALLEAIRD